MYLEDALEVLIEVLVGQATQFVEDPPNLYPTVGVRVSAAFGSDQKPLRPIAFVAYVLGVVVGVAQNEARLFGQLFDERRSYLVVRHVGRGEPRREWNPHPGHGDGQVQLPPIHPPVPARFGPSCLGIYGGVGYLAGFSVFLVPHSTSLALRGVLSPRRPLFPSSP